MIKVQTDYMSNLFRQPEMAKTMEWLIDNVPPFDTVIVRGVSGIVAGSIVANHFGGHLTVVRKNAGSHSSHKVEGAITGKGIIIDDFIDVGNTIRKCIKACPDIEISHIVLYSPRSRPQFETFQGIPVITRIRE